MYDLCELIRKDLALDRHNPSRLAAMDIGYDYQSYMFGIAKLQRQVHNQLLNIIVIDCSLASNCSNTTI